MKQFSSKILETNDLQNLWNQFPPKSLKKIASKIFETIFLQNLWNNFPPKSLKPISFKIFERGSSKIFETNFLPNLESNFPPKSLKLICSKTFETILGGQPMRGWDLIMWSEGQWPVLCLNRMSLQLTAPSRSPSPAVLDLTLK